AFQGGFGLLTLQGVAKPAYRAFELLHHLGTEQLPVDGSHETVDAWVTRGGNSVTVLLTNHALPRHPIKDETVSIQLSGLLSPKNAFIERIDANHANSKRLWIEMGKPPIPSMRQVDQLHAASQIQRQPQQFKYKSGSLQMEVSMPPHAIAAVTVELSANSDARA
ncbi:MAG TPA: hypothetical protein VG722_08195, partial [Tepidisphaeraceae bacterium]|nr:hypothetical protein [Tepidisphaeraceae bacterium]